jgi:SAM-dependent methyltransferase
MWPRTFAGEMKERARKRKLEGNILFGQLSRELAGARTNAPILEFGSGAGYQGDWLGRLGRCVMSDVYVDRDLKVIGGNLFVVCDVTDSPFRSNTFGVIFSNHVIEHLREPARSFKELQRIGREDCLYAFAVPTSVWLILSVPVQYWDKARNLFARIRRSPSERFGDRSGRPLSAVEGPTTTEDGGPPSRLLPHGHGCYPDFVECFRAFRAASWRQYFELHGFTLIREYPVLCYAPAAWPIIPTNRSLVKIGLSSSRLFILRKQST